MNVYYVAGIPVSDNYLAHHGIKGQKWGVRRYQNPDGTLTAEGRKRYSKEYYAENLKKLTKGNMNKNIENQPEFQQLQRITRNKISEFEKQYGPMDKIDSTLNSEYEKLIDKNPNNKLWQEYARWYATDDRTGKFNKEEYETCMKNGRGSLDQSWYAWIWYCDVKNPKTGQMVEARNRLTNDIGEQASQYITKSLGPVQYNVIKGKTWSTKSKESTAREVVSRLLEHYFRENYGLADIGYIARSEYRRSRKRK